MIAVTLVGTVVLSSLLGTTDREPQVAIGGDFGTGSVCDGGNVTLRHAGGDSLSVADLTVILRNGGEDRVAMAVNGTFVGGQGESGRFSAGDIWTYNHS